MEAGGSGCAATAFFHFELQWRRQSPSCTLWMLYSRGIPKIKYQAMCQSRKLNYRQVALKSSDLFQQLLHYFAFNGGNDLASITWDADGINFKSLKAVKHGRHYHNHWFVLIAMSSISLHSEEPNVGSGACASSPLQKIA